jgi:hypothetical protein
MYYLVGAKVPLVGSNGSIEGGLRTLRMTHGCSVLSRSGPTHPQPRFRMWLNLSRAKPIPTARVFHGLPARRGRV